MATGSDIWILNYETNEVEIFFLGLVSHNTNFLFYQKYNKIDNAATSKQMREGGILFFILLAIK